MTIAFQRGDFSQRLPRRGARISVVPDRKDRAEEKETVREGGRLRLKLSPEHPLDNTLFSRARAPASFPLCPGVGVLALNSQLLRLRFNCRLLCAAVPKRRTFVHRREGPWSPRSPRFSPKTTLEDTQPCFVGGDDLIPTWARFPLFS